MTRTSRNQRVLFAGGICVLLLLIAAAVWGWRAWYRPAPTPLTTFAAPFVFGAFTVPADNPLTEESVTLGRHLFYDVRLSVNNQVACATCHQQALAFTDGLKHSVGVSGKPLPFNTMSVVNLLWGPQRFFWDGRSTSLEHQALLPIQHLDEMGLPLDEAVTKLKADARYRDMFRRAYGEITATNIAKALANFQRTLVSANSRYDQYLRGEIRLSELEEQGRKLFMAHPDTKASLRGGNCIDCHSQFVTSGFALAWDGFTNNGLDTDDTLLPGLATTTGNPQHHGKFKTPTLRNIALTAPYMHDGRFATLKDVLNHYNHGIKRSTTLSPLIIEASNSEQQGDGKISLHLSEQEADAIIAFLHTLTDEEFVTNPVFSNPFTETAKHESDR